MVVTETHARGLVRETIRRESARCAAAWSRLCARHARVPETLRGFNTWFKTHERCFDGAAILIVHGTTGRRTGTFCVYMPRFERDERGWTLAIERFRMDFRPGRLLQWRVEDLPIRICGHALERMFQRGATLAWSDVRDALADALVFASVALPQYLAGPYRQVRLPVGNGLLAGEKEAGGVIVKTFLEEAGLNVRHARLLAACRALLAAHPEAFPRATVGGNDELAGEMAALLAQPAHAWLLEPYVPGEDPFANAWASRPTLTGATGSCPPVARRAPTLRDPGRRNSFTAGGREAIDTRQQPLDGAAFHLTPGSTPIGGANR